MLLINNPRILSAAGLALAARDPAPIRPEMTKAQHPLVPGRMRLDFPAFV
jgi:hypothetical protein